jgi:hypothetical protein
VWTTQDELMFIRGLFIRGKIQNLRNYVRVAHERKWWGEGMAVNPMIVILEARDLLAEMERQARDLGR